MSSAVSSVSSSVSLRVAIIHGAQTLSAAVDSVQHRPEADVHAYENRYQIKKQSAQTSPG